MSMSVALSIKEQKNKRNKILFFILMFCVVIFLLFFAAISLVFDSKKSLIANELKLENIEIAKSINQFIDSNIQSLAVSAKLVLENQDLADMENLSSLLWSSGKNGNFEKVSYIYANGSGYEYNVSTANLVLSDYSKNACFLKAINGNNCFTFDFLNKNFQYGVPVKDKKGENIGVILAIQNPSIFSKFLKFDDSSKKYLSYMVTNSGYFLLKDPKVKEDAFDSMFDWKISYFSSPKENSFKNISYGTPVVRWKRGSSVDYNLLIISGLGFSDFRVLTLIPNANFKPDFNFKINKKMVVISIGIGLLIIAFFLFLLQYHRIFKGRSNDAIMKWALYDEVTDGFNKPKFYLEASKIFLNAKEDDKYAIILMDINNFKVINQVYDSIKGNSILKDISNSIKWFLEKDGICARMMSDNFAILYKYKREEKIIAFINNIVRAVGEYKLSVKLLPSFGIFKINDYNLPIDTMIDRALIAKKTIKEDIDIHYAFFSDDLIEEIIAAKEIENEMYYALSQKQFLLYLQPQLDVLTGDIVGAEALTRWLHPEKGLLLPEKFLSVFEKNGFITYIDQFILEEVCRLLRKWMDNGLQLFPISLNISRLHLCNPRFVNMLESIIQMYKIPAKYLNLEVSEEGVFEDIELLKKVVSNLKAVGFMVTLDNFGRKYSSVSVLNDVAFDFLKFDKTFLNKMSGTNKSQNILNQMNILVKSLFIKTVTVGVETDLQLSIAKNMEFDYMQGFVSARPMPVIDFENFVFKRTIENEDLND